MKIDIDSLSYEELLELNHIIVERLKFLDSVSPEKQMKLFNPGDHVSFTHPTQGRISGTLLKYNSKTVSIISASGQRWDVSPHLLRKIVSPPAPTLHKSSNIIKIKKK